VITIHIFVLVEVIEVWRGENKKKRE